MFSFELSFVQLPTMAQLPIFAQLLTSSFP